jgi:hypothetical protein
MRRTIATSFKPRPTNCPGSTSTASDPSRAQGIHEADQRPDSKRRYADGRKNATAGGDGSRERSSHGIRDVVSSAQAGVNEPSMLIAYAKSIKARRFSSYRRGGAQFTFAHGRSRTVE